MSDVLSKVSRALGRSEPSSVPPVPPASNESITRLLRADADLVETFAKVAATVQLKVERATATDVGAKVATFLKEHNCRRIGLGASPLLQRLNISGAIKWRGLSSQSWNDLTLDETYDLDAGVTDVFAAVAETGTLVIRPDPACGRALSLVPPIHVAIVEAKNIVADLVDLMAKISAEGKSANFSLITGPSKTADIEGVLVTGVHGPGLVQIFLMP